MEENQEPLVQQPQAPVYRRDKGERALRKYKKLAWFTGICGLLLLIIGIVMPIVLLNFIKSQAKDQVIMQSDNEDQWGQIPGDTGMVLERQFTFYNWTNAEDFFVRGTKPILRESEPVFYQEYQNFTNPVFSENEQTVDFQFQEYFLPIKNSTGHEIQTVANLGPMGFWYQIKQATRVQISIQTFYGLISGMVDQLYETVEGTAMAELYAKKQAGWNKLVAKQPEMVKIQEWLFTDPNYGFRANAYIWMVAYKEAQDATITNKSTSIFLMNYFKLSQTTLAEFYKANSGNLGAFQAGINIGATLLQGCKNDDHTLLRACLAATQWANLKVAQGVSIVTQNATTIGYPEIYAFQTGYFKNNIDSSARYQSIVWNIEWAKKVTYYIQNPKDNTEYTKLTNTLINQGNLAVLYTNGEQYDQTNDVKYLQVIADRFEINEGYFGANYIDAAYLFWEYAKYMVDIFAEMKQYKNGGSAVAGLTGVASQAIYTVFIETQDNLSINIISALMQGAFMKNKITDCASFNAALNQMIAPKQVDVCVDKSPFMPFDLNTMKYIYQCNLYRSYSDYCNSIDQLFAASVPNFIKTLSELPTIVQIIGFADQTMYTQYNCMSTILKCSNYEIAVKQWYNMEIIRNLPPAIAPFFPPGRDTLQQWLPDELPHAYEWGYYAEKFGDTFSQPVPDLTYTQLSYLLGFDMFFSGTRLSQMFLIDDNFESLYSFQDPSQIRDYFRWVTAFTAFGLTQTREANDLLSGYDDPFLQNIALMNPQEGGDPSTGFNLNFNDVNMTQPSEFQPQGMYTGKGDVNMVRQYTNVNGYDYITFLKPSFDGFNDPTASFVSPWATNIPIVGTDAGANRPDIDKDTDLSIFVTTLYTGGTVENTQIETNFEGLNTYRYQISGCILRNATVCPENVNVYSYEYDYSINLTSIQQAPIFNTKTHMYQMEPDMSQRITLYNKDGNIQTPSEWDDTYILVEPITGTSLSITLNLQGVLLFTPDYLFNKLQEPVMIPFFYVYRSGNFTSEKVDDIFGALKAGLLIKDLILYIGCSLGGVLLLAFIYCMFAIHKLKKSLIQTKEEESDELEQKIAQSEIYA